MTADLFLLPAGAFVAGLVVASVAWWLVRRMRPVAERADRTPSPSPRAPDPATPEPPSATRGVRTVPDGRLVGTLRISQRVILHLARQPRLTYGDVAPFELTQAGMSRALATSQPTLARVLQRLVDGDAILEMRTHVAGRSQRLKVYQLTALGESIARDLRTRARPSAPASPSPGGAAAPPRLTEPPRTAPVHEP